jgi:hypothetical protein
MLRAPRLQLVAPFFVSPTEAQIRSTAVEPQFTGHGFGGGILSDLLKIALFLAAYALSY